MPGETAFLVVLQGNPLPAACNTTGLPRVISPYLLSNGIWLKKIASLTKIIYLSFIYSFPAGQAGKINPATI
jgi:hypothetical protein